MTRATDFPAILNPSTATPSDVEAGALFAFGLWLRVAFVGAWLFIIATLGAIQRHQPLTAAALLLATGALAVYAAFRTWRAIDGQPDLR